MNNEVGTKHKKTSLEKEQGRTEHKKTTERGRTMRY